MRYLDFRGFFKSLDKEGWTDFSIGVVIMLVACVLAYLISFHVHVILPTLVVVFGLFFGMQRVDLAMLGSILRERNGKNMHLYLQRKEYLDIRFKQVYNVDVGQNTKKMTFAEVLQETADRLDRIKEKDKSDDLLQNESENKE